MGFEFASISYPEIERRLLKSSYDAKCYKSLCQTYFPTDNEVALASREYKGMKKQDRTKRIKDIAQKCTNNSIFKGLSWEQVVLETLTKVIPRGKWFDYIFGHKEAEEKTYHEIERLLKEKFGDGVYNTAKKNGKLVRFADFTLVKKNVLGHPSRIASFDVKTTASSFARFLDQAEDFQRFSYKTYLIATPGMILEVGRKAKVRTAEAEHIVIEKVKRVGAGLLVADLTAHSLEDRKEAEERDVDGDAKNDALREIQIR